MNVCTVHGGAHQWDDERIEAGIVHQRCACGAKRAFREDLDDKRWDDCPECCGTGMQMSPTGMICKSCGLFFDATPPDAAETVRALTHTVKQLQAERDSALSSARILGSIADDMGAQAQDEGARLAIAERELDELRTTMRIAESVTAADITVQTGAVILADVDGTAALLMRNRIGEWQTCPGHGESRKYRSADIGKVHAVYRRHFEKDAPRASEGIEPWTA